MKMKKKGEHVVDFTPCMMMPVGRLPLACLVRSQEVIEVERDMAVYTSEEMHGPCLKLSRE